MSGTMVETAGGTASQRGVRAAAFGVARLALAASFLSAVADRLGIWGPPGTSGVAWGDLSRFEAYVAKLNWFVPPAFIPWIGWTATSAEVLLAVGLIIGWRLRWFAMGSALLLALFATAMFAALGPKPPLDYSVPTAASAALLLAVSIPSNGKRKAPGWE
jgi:uncharacterized membrane protein YphA (DoxX/SURF4 family)